MGDVVLSQEMRMEFMMLLLESAYANKDITNIDKPEDIKNATDDYITELNSIGGWIQDTLEITGVRGDSIKATDLYGMYKTSSLYQAEKISLKAFIAEMKYNKIETRLLHGSIHFYGIKYFNKEE